MSNRELAIKTGYRSMLMDLNEAVQINPEALKPLLRMPETRQFLETAAKLAGEGYFEGMDMPPATWFEGMLKLSDEQ